MLAWLMRWYHQYHQTRHNSNLNIFWQPFSYIVVAAGRYLFFYTQSPAKGFDILAAILLLLMFSETVKQKSYTLPFITVSFLVFYKLNFISRLFGGL
ncbi:MAG: hypothetical protein WA110_07570 [Anaerolineaceae bacterium]